jgi:hypothetical protein
MHTEETAGAIVDVVTNANHLEQPSQHHATFD